MEKKHIPWVGILVVLAIVYFSFHEDAAMRKVGKVLQVLFLR